MFNSREVFPLAYHLTFGTYGTRLHGDERGTVDRSHNRPGDPILGRDDEWERVERNLLRFDPVIFTPDQRLYIESKVPEVSEKGGWEYHIAAGRPVHVHVLLSAAVEGRRVRRWFKTFLGQSIDQRWSRLHSDATWWAECGSVKWVWTQEYFDNVYAYILRQRCTPVIT